MVAAPVATMLATLPDTSGVGVSAIDGALSDTAAFCEKYQVGPERAANCVVLRAKRGEEVFYAACVILATTRADVNGLVRQVLDIKKVSFAPMENAVSLSGMEYGAITPIGLPAAWPILVDKAAADSESVIVGAGVRAAKLLVPGSLFASIPNVQILEGLGQMKI